MRVLWFSLALLALDQASKQLVVMTMTPGQSIPVIGDLLRFTYTTNPGMAFGLEVGPKLFLTLFSIAATIGIIVYMWYVRSGPIGYRMALAGIVGGAMGNVIDRTFYGVIYGYAPLFHGEVVDFIHIDLWRGVVDVPLLGPMFIPLFPIWNVADMAIVIGVAVIILFQGRFQRQMAAQSASVGEIEPQEPSAEPVNNGAGDALEEGVRDGHS